MTNKEIENKARKIFEFFEMLGLKKYKGYFLTGWGKKNKEGVIASIFNIIAESEKESKNARD